MSARILLNNGGSAMKKFISAIIVLLCIFSSTEMNVNAQSYDSKAYDLQSVQTVLQRDFDYIGDGLYICTELSQYSPSIYTSPALTVSSSKSATLTSTVTDSSGNVLIKYVLSATFTYNGSSATCTSASYSTNVYSNGWSFSNATSSKSGNTAYGAYTAVNKVLLITVQSISRNLTISCDKDGNISRTY